MCPECRHVKTNGLKCKSPALRGMPYCYYHARLHRASNGPRPLKFSVLETSQDIQNALAKVLANLDPSRLTARRLELYLWALQIASQHVNRNKSISSSDIVRSATRPRGGNELAPVEQVCEAPGGCEDCNEKARCLNYLAPHADLS